jgi:enoyl-CoA hydratase
MVLEPTTYDFLSVTIERNVAVATIDHPDRKNAVRPGESSELTRFLEEVGADERVHVAVLAGKGDVFCAGGGPDAIDLYRTDDAAFQTMHENSRGLVRAHIELDKPVVTALNGLAAGVGAAFGLFADFIIADRSVRFGDGHIRAGLVAGDGGVLIWPLAMGMTRAKRYLLTGDWITATEAERLGLVTEVVDDGQCLARALEVADRLARGPQSAIRGTKRSLNRHYAAALAAFELSVELEGESFRDPALGELMDALRNGRPAIPRDARVHARNVES